MTSRADVRIKAEALSAELIELADRLAERETWNSHSIRNQKSGWDALGKEFDELIKAVDEMESAKESCRNVLSD